MEMSGQRPCTEAGVIVSITVISFANKHHGHVFWGDIWGERPRITLTEFSVNFFRVFEKIDTPGPPTYPQGYSLKFECYLFQPLCPSPSADEVWMVTISH